jgi:hypothetical protein
MEVLVFITFLSLFGNLYFLSKSIYLRRNKPWRNIAYNISPPPQKKISENVKELFEKIKKLEKENEKLKLENKMLTDFNLNRK